ncbi:MAG: ABC transporter ATP-binding protein/permease [Erysipelotrichaceae bacterium]
MFNKRLLKLVPGSMKYIMMNVVFQWAGLIANIVLMINVANYISRLYLHIALIDDLYRIIIIFICTMIIRFISYYFSNRASFSSSKEVKQKLRRMIYEKMLRLGTTYDAEVETSGIVQVATEGVEQLETYFGSYLPQLFYSLLAPFTLFVIIGSFSLKTALILLICVPLIPVTIVAVQKFAKRLLSGYWDQYTKLGDSFLENLQGLTTLKIYEADEYKQEKMNEEAENFRKITMKVLSMQLNSITVMDIVAYGGAALGIIVALIELRKGNIDLAQCLIIILLSGDFFIPMRMLGSFFHVAMNGMSAADKIFRLLDMEEKEKGKENIQGLDIEIKNLNFSYDSQRQILKNININIPEKSFISLVGESGSGKSTIASILYGNYSEYEGSITIDNKELRKIEERNLLQNICYVSFNSYLFRGTVRDNLKMAKEDATDEEMLEVLKKVNLYAFLESEKGLDTKLMERGNNFSGGQRQRLTLARALLHDAKIYIFDEATSNIDMESENDIMQVIMQLVNNKTVILISHRLANVVNSDSIYVLKDGEIKESGSHEELLNKKGLYSKMYEAQISLENYAKENEDEKKCA